MHSSWVLFAESWNFYKLKRWGLISGGNQFCRKWIIWSPLLYLKFKSFLHPNWQSFIRFQSILHGSEVFFSESWNFYKLKRGNLISGGNQFCRKSQLLYPPFCISILKVLWSEIYSHSLEFNAFSMIQEYFSQSV